jgi:carboxypeptidase D
MMLQSSLTPRWHFLQVLAALTAMTSLVSAVRLLPNDASLASLEDDWQRQLVDVNLPKDPADHLVTALPLLEASKFPTEHWAGLIPASADGDKYLFYWLFAPDLTDHPDVKEEDIPLIVWLNGGPACSSMDGLWLENGPFRLQETEDKKWEINLDPHSWHKAPAYVVYIDQPVGTGISFTTSKKYPTNDQEVNKDFYSFMTKFLQLHDDKFLDGTTLKRPFFFSGESHAGHYIPSMMNYIRQQNDLGTAEVQMPLSGAAIGNGWVDPRYQYSAQDAAYGYGILGRAQVNALAEKEEKCQSDLQAGKYVSGTCFSLLDYVIDGSGGDGSPYRVSQYDNRKWEHTGVARDFPPGHKIVEAYLGGWKVPSDQPDMGVTYTDVLEAVHATPSNSAGQRYKECTDPPYNALKHQDGKGVTEDVIALLNAGTKMLFFNGVHDLICNHVGNEKFLEFLAWDQQTEYVVSNRYAWVSSADGSEEGKLAGYMKEHANLLFLKVLNSGHMVPMDVPHVALDMMRTLVYGKSFQSYQQAITPKATPVDPSCPVCPSGGDGKSCPICEDCHNYDEISSDESSSSESDDGSGTNTNHKSSTNPNGGESSGGGKAWLFAFLGMGVGLGCAYFYTNGYADGFAPVTTRMDSMMGGMEMQSGSGSTSQFRDIPDEADAKHGII